METKYIPAIPIHPGEVLREDYMEPMSLSASELARALGVSRQTVAQLAAEKRSLSHDLAARLSLAFGTSVQVWLRLQYLYELAEVMNKAESLKGKVKPIEMK